MDITTRRQEVKNKRFCYRCLCSSHTREWCGSRMACLVCNKNHHTMLHLHDRQNKHKHSTDYRSQRETNNRVHRNYQKKKSNSQNSPPRYTTTAPRQHSDSKCKETSRPLVRERLDLRSRKHVFLPTALARVLTNSGPEKARLMLNSAGLQTVILRSMVNRLNLRTTKKNGEVFCTVSLQSYQDSAAKIQISGIVKTNCNITLPESTSEKRLQSVYDHLTDLADPHFFKPTNIEIFIGNDQLSKILLAGLIQTSSSMPIAQSSIFGWIISGACLY